MIEAKVLTALALLQASGECWQVDRFQGVGVYSDAWEIQEDGLPGGNIICFFGTRGTVSGSDLQFAQFGDGTLIGWSENAEGLENVEVYQLHREERKITYVTTRNGTKSLVPLFPDSRALLQVGDARRMR